MILHTFGDSHSRCASWKTISVSNLEIKCYTGTPTTMARFGIDKLSFLNIKDFGVNENDMVCFCFGEIDCRAHFTKPQNFKIYKELINEIVSRYFEAIKINVEQYKNLTTIVFNVVPPTKFFNDGSFIGTDEERKIVVLYMNSKLKELCKKYNYIFFDVYDKYCDNTGFLNSKLKDSTVHIGNGIYIEEFLKNKL